MSSLLRVAAVAIVLTGCGPAGKPRLPVFPVTGRVTFDGKPCPGAKIIFHLIDNQDPNFTAPIGTVAPDGSLAVTTYQENDGAPAGKYSLTAFWSNTDGGEDSKERFPEKFQDPDPKVSGLPTVEIKPQPDNTLKLELKR